MKLCRIGALSFLFFLFFVPEIQAQAIMEGGLYKIEPGGQIESTSYQTKTPAAITSFGSYSFDVSESLIDFGNTLPTNPVTRKNTISLGSDSVSYFLKTYENHQLLSQNSASVIADTTCDSGECSENVPSIWESVLVYGFGYHCDGGESCEKEFLDQNSYKQFANKSKDENPQNLLGGASGKNEINITYRLNVSSRQGVGAYSNVVTFMLLPGF